MHKRLTSGAGNLPGLRLVGVCCVLLTSLTACKSISPPAFECDPAAAKLAEAATSISQSLVTLAEVQQAQLPAKDLSKLPKPDMLNMPEVISVDWSGPIEPFLERMADASGYKLNVVGVKPAIPVIVTITARHTPLAHIIRDAAYQCMTKAEIEVFPCKKTIELRYAKA